MIKRNMIHIERQQQNVFEQLNTEMLEIKRNAGQIRIEAAILFQSSYKCVADAVTSDGSGPGRIEVVNYIIR